MSAVRQEAAPTSALRYAELPNPFRMWKGGTLVRAQVGLTILPEGSVPAGDPELVEVRFERPAPKRSVLLVFRADVQPPPALSAFLAVVRTLSA